MSYSFYQQGPAWGTNQFRFGAPPAPSFHPQPSWRGLDFYRAHATSPDPSLYDSAWSRVRDYNYSNYRDFSGGVGIHEARHWHSRAYGGMGELNQMIPAEIGHAAAYEAYRKWIHHSSMYEPLSGDFDRQREALIGLAIAETTLLLQYTPRGIDPYTRRAAAEAAAATASQIFFWSCDHDDYDASEFYSGRGRSYSYGSSSYGDPYGYDSDLIFSRRRPRSHSRHRSRSSSYRHPLLEYPGSHSSSSLPIAAGGSTYGSQYGGMPVSSSPGRAYSSGMPVPMSMSSSYHSNMPTVLPVRSRSTSMNMVAPYANGISYAGTGMPYTYVGALPQTQYVHAGGFVMPPGQAPQTQMVVYTKPHKRHHHHHHHSKHGHRSRRSRSVSMEPAY